MPPRDSCPPLLSLAKQPSFCNLGARGWITLLSLPRLLCSLQRSSSVSPQLHVLPPCRGSPRLPPGDWRPLPVSALPLLAEGPEAGPFWAGASLSSPGCLITESVRERAPFRPRAPRKPPVHLGPELRALASQPTSCLESSQRLHRKQLAPRNPLARH